MKILRITSLGYEDGGVENGIALLQPVLEGMGHQVKTLASDLRPVDKKAAIFSDFEFKALSKQPGALKFIYRCFYPDSYSALKKALKEFNPDIVQLHTMNQVSPSVLFLLDKYPAVVTIHGSEDFTRGLLLWGLPLNLFRDKVISKNNLTAKGWLHFLYHRYLNGQIYRLGFRNIDAFIAFSGYMKTELGKEGINCKYIPNATQLFEASPIDADGRTIVYAGRVEIYKGVQYIIMALSKIVSRFPEAKLLIAGTGGYAEELEKLAKRQNLQKNVNFLGYQDRKNLYEIYKKATVVIMPSIWPEPFGKIGIEAMSVGRPVIATDVGGISEWLIDGKTGYKVPIFPDDGIAEQIAEKVIRLFSNKGDLLMMSENSLKQSKEFSIEKHAERIIEFYDQVIKKRIAAK